MTSATNTAGDEHRPVRHEMAEEVGPDGRRVVCDCGRRSAWFPPDKGKHDQSDPRQSTRLDGWRRQHENDVLHDHVRDRKSSSIRDGLAWYRERAADPAEPEHQRVLWRQLVEETEARINSSGKSEDVPLW